MRRRDWIAAVAFGLMIIGTGAGIAACGPAPTTTGSQLSTATVPLPNGRQVLCVTLPYNKGISCDWEHAS